MTLARKSFLGLFLSIIIFTLIIISSAQENQTKEIPSKTGKIITSLIDSLFNNFIYIILILIISPYIALKQYDRILLNKKRYEAWKEIWDIKTKTFGNLINELYDMSDVVCDLHELSDVNVKNPKGFDCSILLGWIHLIETRDRQKFVPEEIKSVLARWSSVPGEIKEGDQFGDVYRKVLTYRRFRAHVAFFRISQLRQIVNLYVQNAKMLSELAEIANKALEACKKDYGPDDDLNQFAEWFSSDLSLVIRQMKEELNETIQSNKVNLTLTKPSLG